MHDPRTLAFEIGIPLGRRTLRNSRGEAIGTVRTSFELLNIWHQDPERDGSDDSCGWAYVRLTEKQQHALVPLSDHEAEWPTYTRHRGKRLEDDEARARLARDLVLDVLHALRLRVSPEQRDEFALLLRDFDFAFLPGWHENSTDPRRECEDRRRYWRERVHSAASIILTELRPWWQHPRWHVHHWRIHQPQLLRAWHRLTERCSYCNKRFGWRRTDGSISHGWDSAWHRECGERAVARMRDEGTLAK